MFKPLFYKFLFKQLTIIECKTGMLNLLLAEISHFNDQQYKNLFIQAISSRFLGCH